MKTSLLLPFGVLQLLLCGLAWAAPQAPAGLSSDVPKEARELFDRGDYDGAAKVFERILEKTPDYPNALCNLGIARFRTGKLKAAVSALKRATELAPKDAFSHYVLGVVYYSLNQREECMRELEAALLINPEYRDAESFLNLVSSENGWSFSADGRKIKGPSTNRGTLLRNLENAPKGDILTPLEKSRLELPPTAEEGLLMRPAWGPRLPRDPHTEERFQSD